MATRRIARGRGGSPVPIIVLSVIVVGLLGSTIVLGLSVGDLEKKILVTESKLTTAGQELKAAYDKFSGFERIVGFKLEGARLEFERLKKDLKDKSPDPRLPAIEANAFVDMRTLVAAYVERCAKLEQELKLVDAELEKAKEQRATAIADAKATADAKQKQVDTAETVANDLRKKKTEVEEERDRIRTTLTTEVEQLKGDKTKLTKDVAALVKDVKVRDDKIKKLEEKLKDALALKPTRDPLAPTAGPEPLDGKVLTVDADGSHVMVDVGRKDWVEVGMFFTVYERSGLQERREKGQIQIRHVFDEIARAKIIKQDELDPLLPGMIIINPAFKRGTKLEFVLVGKFTEPRIEQMLTRYPCSIGKVVTRATDYLVLGDAKTSELDTPPEETEEFYAARDNKVTIMREKELLHYLGERE